MQDLNDEPIDVCTIADDMQPVMQAYTETNGKLNFDDICWAEEGIDQSDAQEGLGFLMRLGFIVRREVPPPNTHREDQGYGTGDYDDLADDDGYGTRG